MILMQLLQIDSALPPEGYPLFAVARSESVDLLRQLYIAEVVDPYTDTIDGKEVRKVFRKNGPLENYVPPVNPMDMFIDIGTLELRLQSLIADLTSKVSAEWTAVENNVAICNTQEDLNALLISRLPVSSNGEAECQPTSP